MEEQKFDCFLQVQTLGLAHRFMLYFNDPEIKKRLFPKGGCEIMEHIAPWGTSTGSLKTHRHHDVLLLLRNLAVSPAEFKRWIDSSFFKYSVARIFFCADREASSQEDLVRQLSEMEPPKGPCRLYIYPKTLERYVADQLVEAWELHPVTCTHTLHAVAVSPTLYRFAVRPAEETFKTSPDGPTRVGAHCCRAAAKISEALEVAGFQPGSGAAVDVGAAPGGWTAVLAESMRTVVAVDPADLDADVAALPNVVHVQKKSQDAMVDILQALDGQPIDLIVCDANRHPDQIKDFLAPMFSLLRPGGLAVITFKFRGKGQERGDGTPRAQAMLGPEFEEPRVLWLLSNTQSERTVCARKKNEDGLISPAVEGLTRK